MCRQDGHLLGDRPEFQLAGTLRLGLVRDHRPQRWPIPTNRPRVNLDGGGLGTLSGLDPHSAPRPGPAHRLEWCLLRRRAEGQLDSAAAGSVRSRGVLGQPDPVLEDKARGDDAHPFAAERDRQSQAERIVDGGETGANRHPDTRSPPRSRCSGLLQQAVQLIGFVRALRARKQLEPDVGDRRHDRKHRARAAQKLAASEEQHGLAGSQWVATVQPMHEPIHIPSISALREHVGEVLGPSDWVTVSQERIRAFAEATGDRQWIHTDPERATAESPFGTPIAHGYLTISLAPPLIDQLYQISDCRMTVNYGIEKMRLQEPVPAGARIRLSAEIRKVRMLPSGAARATVHFVFEVEGGTRPACVCDAVLVYFP